MKMIRKRAHCCIASVTAMLCIFGSMVHAAPVNVWLDNGTKAPGSTSSGTAYNGLRDATWDVTATEENGLADIGAAVMNVRLVSFIHNGNSRKSTDGGGNGLAVYSGSNNFWMDALNHEGVAFQLKFYSDAAKTEEITDLDITFKSLMARTASSNLAVNVYAGSGELAISGDATNDTDMVTLDGTDLGITYDSTLAFAGETDLIPSGFIGTGFYTISGTDAVTFGEEDTFWLRRYNLNSQADTAYQVANLAFDVVPKPATVSVWLDDGTKAPGSTSAGTSYANLRDGAWDVTATQENGLADIGAAVMSVRLVSFIHNGNSRKSTNGGGNGLTVYSGSNNFWMDAVNYEGAAFQLKFYSDLSKTQEIKGMDITFRSIMVRTANANLAVNAYAGSGALAISGDGTNDTDMVSLDGADMDYSSDSANSFAEETDLVPIGFNGPDFYTVNGTHAITFSEDDTFWVRRDNLNGASDTAYQVANLTFELQKIGGYDGWAAGYGLQEPATGDDDNDGLSNLQEYGLGGNPTNALDQGISPVCSVMEQSGSNVFHYVYPQLSDPSSGLTYYLELNTDLVSGTWTNTGYIVAGTNLTGGTFDFVTNTTDMASDVKFIRLVVE
ncbi:hypothetical protein [Tichowtungia aerotolerans]|uniref:Uncharacterized protein n=1 Tax=Tichowtungia aerotolerans TaxID=2697043 RepID=A0A6P1M516_9BACT|nr:hypothetical protein [Tichowtungia aerotolerans]QHI69142.1 hypothetical protein GT409_06660 [Tichowtungia aerotolerans]